MKKAPAFASGGLTRADEKGAPPAPKKISGSKVLSSSAPAFAAGGPVRPNDASKTRSESTQYAKSSADYKAADADARSKIFARRATVTGPEKDFLSARDTANEAIDNAYAKGMKKLNVSEQTGNED